MTEADFKNLQKTLENMDDPKPYELSGSHGGAKPEKKTAKEGEVEMPAQSSEPPVSASAPVATPAPTSEKKAAPKKDEETTPHRGR